MNTPLFIAIVLILPLLASPANAQLPIASPNAASIPSDSPVTGTRSSASSASSPVSTGTPAATGGQPGAEEMQQMMALSKLGENHKLLADLAGNWTYTVKMWMDPAAPPNESKGASTTKPIMDGRYFVTEAKGTFKMPGADGKMKDFNFTGMGIQGYDNAQKKFVTSWIDNMGTGIILSEGIYDPATKTLTYHAEHVMIPGTKTKIREVIKVTDKDHHTMEWYEDRGGEELKTMEIAYTRKK